MEARTFNADGAPALLFVMGFGDRLDGENERWFIDRLADAGFRVTAVQLHTDMTDFEREYREPVQRRHDDLEPAVVLGQSLGGLVAAHLETSARTGYLAPWWGFYGEKFLTWESRLVPRLPIETPVLSIRTDRSELGALVTDEQWRRLPKRLSPVFVTAVYRAQERRPPVDEDAVVFVSLRDTVVGLDAIGAAVAPEQVRLYEGGHQLFASASRRAVTGDVVEALTA